MALYTEYRDALASWRLPDLQKTGCRNTFRDIDIFILINRYFQSRFHCLDATVIVAGFVLDVLLKGVLEEIGSLVVVLRLWRVFKIIEELSAGAEEQMEPLRERLTEVEKENEQLRRRLNAS